MTTPEAGRRGESAPELLEEAKSWLEPLIKYLPPGPGYGAVKAAEKIDQALELLRNAEIDDFR